MKLKKIAAALSVVGLVVVAPSAMADINVALDLTPIGPSLWTASFNQTYGAPTTFEDTFGFNWVSDRPTVPSTAAGTAIVSYNPFTQAPTTVFTSVEFVNLTTNTTLMSTGSSSGFSIVSYTLPFALNTTDDYAFRLSGNTIGGGGSYGGTITVSAVPEPESYALFLAGLGIMGAIARRRWTEA